MVKMILKISQIQQALYRGLLDLWHPIHAAGTRPNSMNRFLHSNSQEVLFVN